MVRMRTKAVFASEDFLDVQKHAIPTRCTTASRPSYRFFVSLCARLQLCIEIWDISGAFLKGFSFKELDALYRKLGLNPPKRRVVIQVPKKVWRHMREIKDSDIHVLDYDS